MYDVVIIGAGVIGCSAARELSRYRLKIAVLERGSEVCEGTSKANSGIVHAGYDATYGTRKAQLNIEGNLKMEQLCRDLEVPFKRNGSLVLCMQEEDLPILTQLMDNGLKNGVPGLQLLQKEEVLRMEPQVNKNVVGALYAPTGGIVCPFTLTIALAENAFENGVEFYLNTTVTEVKKVKDDEGYIIHTNQGGYQSRVVINAAGVYADVFHNMISKQKIKIIARKGEYCLFDKDVGNFVTRTLFPLPSRLGKGVLVTPTIHGNLMAGPTAMDCEEKDEINTTDNGLREVLIKSACSVEDLPLHQIITSFSGLRAHEEQGDFILGEPSDAPGFIDLAGMESPGLTCAPAIGRFTVDLVKQIIPCSEKDSFIQTRKGVVHMNELELKEQIEQIQKDPTYGNVVCRCELVTEGELIDAINRPLGAKTLDGLKRRTRAGAGRCQAGFCTPKAMEILARELGIPIEEVTKSGGTSRMLLGGSKESKESSIHPQGNTQLNNTQVSNTQQSNSKQDNNKKEYDSQYNNSHCSTPKGMEKR